MSTQYLVVEENKASCQFHKYFYLVESISIHLPQVPTLMFYQEYIVRNGRRYVYSTPTSSPCPEFQVCQIGSEHGSTSSCQFKFCPWMIFRNASPCSLYLAHVQCWNRRTGHRKNVSVTSIWRCVLEMPRVELPPPESLSFATIGSDLMDIFFFFRNDAIMMYCSNTASLAHTAAISIGSPAWLDVQICPPCGTVSIIKIALKTKSGINISGTATTVAGRCLLGTRPSSTFIKLPPAAAVFSTSCPFFYFSQLPMKRRVVCSSTNQSTARLSALRGKLNPLLS
jgi:hypothetical protein